MATLCLKKSSNSVTSVTEKQKKNKPKSINLDRLAEIKRIINIFQNDFPIAFPKAPSLKPPLKIGIHKDLCFLADDYGFSKRNIRLALDMWCDGFRYWKSFRFGSMRIDLNGNKVEQLEQEHIRVAKNKLFKLKSAKFKKNKQKTK